MDFHEVLCDKQHSRAGEKCSHDILIPAADITGAVAHSVAPAPTDTAAANHGHTEATTIHTSSAAEADVLDTAAESVADVISNVVADEVVVDVLGELLMGLHSSLFGPDDTAGSKPDLVRSTTPALPKFKSIKKRVGGGFVYVQVLDEANAAVKDSSNCDNDGEGAGRSEGSGGSGSCYGGHKNSVPGSGRQVMKLPRRGSMGTQGDKSNSSRSVSNRAKGKGPGVPLPRLTTSRTKSTKSTKTILHRRPSDVGAPELNAARGGLA